MLATEGQRKMLSQPMGFTVCWDNVGIVGEAKHQYSLSENTFLMFGLCFAAKNRVSFEHLTNDGNVTDESFLKCIK